MSLEDWRPRHRVLGALLRHLSLVLGLALLGAVVLLALAAPWLYPGDPLDMVGAPLLWPGEDAAYPLGTDSLGRDLAAGLAHGARVSLLVGVSAAVIGLLIGTTVGAIGGYAGGRVDNVLVRLTELFQTVPTFLLVIILVLMREPSAVAIALSIGLASWPTVARLARAEFRSLRSADFVAAALVSGARPSRIILRHILPNAVAPIVVTTSVMVANAILTEAGLSFLGLGDPNRVSWGSMIGEGRELLRTAWYLTALPGTAIAITVMAINLAGDGLNDLLNPRAAPR